MFYILELKKTDSFIFIYYLNQFKIYYLFIIVVIIIVEVSPEKDIVASLLRSKGGAHFRQIAWIQGKVTPCRNVKCKTK